MLPHMLRHYTPQLCELCLLSPSQCAELLTHCAGYPRHHRHKIFFEYQLDDGQMQLAGYGHGYSQDAFTALLRNPAFQKTETGSAVQLARQNDPFLAERLRFLDLHRTNDPEWIEYDYDGRFRGVPAMFFKAPIRYQSWYGTERLCELADILRPVLPDVGDNPHAFYRLFEHLVQRESARGRNLEIYRVGRCAERADGWLKFILSGLAPDTLDELGAIGFADVDLSPIRRTLDLYPDQSEPKLALSVDVHHGIVAAFDLECPYFHTPRADEHRQASVRFSEGLVRDGLLNTETSRAIHAATQRHFDQASDGSQGMVLLNHYKFGIWGRTRGRIKAYFELIVRHPHDEN